MLTSQFIIWILVFLTGLEKYKKGTWTISWIESWTLSVPKSFNCPPQPPIFRHCSKKEYDARKLSTELGTVLLCIFLLCAEWANRWQPPWSQSDHKKGVCVQIKVRVGYYIVSERGRERGDRSRLWFIALVYKQLDWCDRHRHGQLPYDPQEEGEAVGVGLNFYLRLQLRDSLTVNP